MTFRVARALAALLVAAAAASSAWAAQVEVFSPQGEVKGVRQVAARFSEPMVAFGDPRLADPFDIDCPQPGAGRWADQRNWVFDFERDLPAGVRCSFHVKPDLKTLAGAPVEPQQFSFTHRRAGGDRADAVARCADRRGADLHPRPGCAGQAEATVREHAWCDAKGITEKIGVQLVTGEERRQILDSRKDFVDRWLIALFKDGRTARSPSASSSAAAAPSSSRARSEPGSPWCSCAAHASCRPAAACGWCGGRASSRCRACRPARTRCWSSRCVPPSPPSFSCQRVNAMPTACRSRRCSSASRRRSRAARPKRCCCVAPMASSTSRSCRIPTQDGDFVEALEFAGPFPEQASFKLEIPADLRDDAGRTLINQKRFPLTRQAPTSRRRWPSSRRASASSSSKADGDAAGHPAQPGARGAGPAVERARDGKTDSRAACCASAAPMRATVVDWMRRVRDQEHVEYEPPEEEGGRARSRLRGGRIAVQRGRIARARSRCPSPLGARAFEVVGIPLKQPGFYVVELASPKLGEALLAGANPEPGKHGKPGVSRVQRGAGDQSRGALQAAGASRRWYG